MNFFEWLSKVRATKDLSVHPRTEHSRSVVVYKLENAYIYIYIYLQEHDVDIRIYNLM